MFASLKDLAALVLAGLAALSTYASIGHVHAPVVHRSAVVQPGSSDLELISGDLNTTTPPLPKPTPAPTPTSDDSQPARAGELDQGGQAPGGSAPAARPVAPPPAPAPPPLVIGSAQQSYINADRAAAGLPPLTWSSCLAGIAAGQSAAMAPAGSIFHGNGVNQDFGCGLGSRQTGENVGYWSAGVNDAQLNTMFMSSPEHRANILGPYRYAGTAWVVGKNGYGYITVESPDLTPDTTRRLLKERPRGRPLLSYAVPSVASKVIWPLLQQGSTSPAEGSLPGWCCLGSVSWPTWSRRRPRWRAGRSRPTRWQRASWAPAAWPSSGW